MNSTVNYTKKSASTPFPKLMILKSTNTIILATDVRNDRPIGTILFKGKDCCWTIGTTSDWSEDFEDFKGEITLSNE